MYDNLKEYCSHHALSLRHKSNKKVYYESIHRSNHCDCTNCGYLCPYAIGILFKGLALDAMSKNFEIGHTVDEINFDLIDAIQVEEIDFKWHVLNPCHYVFINTTAKSRRDRRYDTQLINKRELELVTGIKVSSERKLTALENALAIASRQLEEQISKNHPEAKRRKL